MQHSKGSFGLIFLISLLGLTFLAQLMLYYLKADYSRTIIYAQNLQQRHLCTALARWLVKHEEMIDTINFNYSLVPSTEELQVQGTHTVSSDNYFEHYAAQVAMGTQRQLLNRLVFRPGEQLQALGKQYMFISQNGLTGKDYLTTELPSTSGEIVTLPTLNFLATRVHTTINMTTIHDYGFSQSFMYSAQNITFTYDKTAAKTNGEQLVASTKEIVFQKNFHAPDRLIILSNSLVTLEENVHLDNVLIIAKGKVKIKAGCTVKGVIFSNSGIEILGKGNFTHDANVVADFVSAYFIV